MKKDGGVINVELQDLSLDEEGLKKYPDLSEGKYIKLTVSDTGHGMNNLTMERIFEPFFTTKDRGEGTGLGLSVVHGIMKSYHGLITVQSEINKGTTFELIFPAIETCEFSGVISQIKEIPTGTERILLVDDDNELVEMLNINLSMLGYKVSGFTSSIDALKEFYQRQDEFDLLITDYTLPKMTGVELAKNLLHIRPSLPVIICSGYSELLTHNSVKSFGISELLIKPVAHRDMAEAIRRVLDE
jgi:CheY-like chemotaxis protein